MLAQTSGKHYPKSPLELLGKKQETKAMTKEEWEIMIHALLGKPMPKKE